MVEIKDVEISGIEVPLEDQELIDILNFNLEEENNSGTVKDVVRKIILEDVGIHYSN